jgi:hypothetical protein
LTTSFFAKEFAELKKNPCLSLPTNNNGNGKDISIFLLVESIILEDKNK